MNDATESVGRSALMPWSPPERPHDWATEVDDPWLDPTTEAPVPSDPTERAPDDPGRSAGTRSGALRGAFRDMVGSKSERSGGTSGTFRLAWVGARDIKAGAHRWVTEHEDSWALREHRDGETRHFRSFAEFKAERARVQAELDERRKVLILGSLAGACGALILFAILLTRLSAPTMILLMFACTGGALGALRARGVGALRRDAPPALPERDPGQPERTGDTVSLTAERVTGALRAQGLIGEKETIGLSGAKVEANGCSVTVKLPPSRIAAVIITAREKLAAGLDSDIPLISVAAVPGSARSFRLTEYATDPMDSAANPSPPSPLVHVERTWVNKPIPLGRTLSGRRVTMRCVDGAHLLLAGSTGSGKSNAARVRCLGFSLDPDATQTIIDPKGAPAWRLFRGVAEVFSGPTPDVQRAAARHMLWLAEEDLPRRMEVLARYAEANPGLVADDAIDDAMARNQELDVPYRQVWIDECGAAYAFKAPFDPADEKSETCGAIIERTTKILITQGRSLGYTVDQGLQRPSATNMSTDIRAIATGKLCGSLEEDADARMMFGSRFREQGVDPVKGLRAHDHVGWMFLSGAARAEPSDVTHVLVHCDLADVTATKMALDRALKVCTEVRPRILSAANQQATPPAPAKTESLAADDPMHLEALAEAFGPDLQLHSVTIVARLREIYPDDPTYADLTARGMNAFLKPLGLRTRNANEGDSRRKGLHLEDIQHALNDRYASDPDDGTQASAFPAPYAETVPLTSTGTQERSAGGPQSGAQNPRIGLVPSLRSPHLGSVPLPDPATSHPGGFS